MKPNKKLSHEVKSGLRGGQSSRASKMADPQPVQLHQGVPLELLQNELAPHFVETRHCFQPQGSAVVVRTNFQAWLSI